MERVEEAPGSRAPGWAVLALLLAGSACAESQEADPTPLNDPGGYNMVEPVPDPAALDPEREGFTPGRWTEAAVDGSPGLAFAAPGQEPVFRAYCHGRGGLVFERLQKPSIGDLEFMEVQAGTHVARFAVNEVKAATPTLRSIVPFNDDLLVRLARPEGMLSIKASDTQPLAMPLNAATAELVRTCERPADTR